MIVGAAGGGRPDDGSFVLVAFMAQFSAAAAYNITYAPYVSDYSRYLPRETTNRSIIASVFFGASGSAIWLIALGAWLAVSLGADRRPRRPEDRRQQRVRPPRRPRRVLLRRRAGGDDGHERLRRRC